MTVTSVTSYLLLGKALLLLLLQPVFRHSLTVLWRKKHSLAGGDQWQLNTYRCSECRCRCFWCLLGTQLCTEWGVRHPERALTAVRAMKGCQEKYQREKGIWNISPHVTPGFSKYPQAGFNSLRLCFTAQAVWYTVVRCYPIGQAFC